MKKIKTIVIILLVIAVGAVGYLYMKNEQNKDMNGTSISGYVLGQGMSPDLTPEEIQKMLQKKVDESKVAFRINSEPTFKGKKGNIFFVNPRYSAHNLDLEVKVDNKVIIKTEKISPDQYIENIELIGKALKKGTHKGEARIKAYSKKTDEVVGEVAVEMIITSK